MYIDTVLTLCLFPQFTESAAAASTRTRLGTSPCAPPEVSQARGGLYN